MRAACQCGKLSVRVPGPSEQIVACHCVDCQKRTGSPFGVLANYPEDAVEVTGEAVRYERPTATGYVFATYFCPTCGSSVYARGSRFPGTIAVAVGALADPAFPPPVRSVWEQDKHDWVILPEPMQHFRQGSTN